MQKHGSEHTTSTQCWSLAAAVAEIELAFRIYKNGEKEKSWFGLASESDWLSRRARNIEIQKKRRRRRATRSFAANEEFSI
jgi:hypothetical protein